MAPGVATPEDVELLLRLFPWDYRQMFRARDNEGWERFDAVPFHYLPSIAAHSGPFLPQDPVAYRSFTEWALARYKEILSLDVYETIQQAQEALEYHISLLRVLREELTSSRARYYSPFEEQVINFLADCTEEKFVKMAVENNVYLAKLAEQAERYEGEIITPPSFLCPRALITCCVTEMVECMKNVASADQELSVEERNLLSVAYKNVIGARRASWRIVTSIEQKEESKGNDSQVGLIKEYRQKIEAELAKICEDILEVLDEHLIKSAQSGESKVFYHKMYVQHPTRTHTTPAIEN